MILKVCVHRSLGSLLTVLLAGSILAACQPQSHQANSANTAGGTAAPGTAGAPQASLKLNGYESTGIFDARLEAALKTLMAKSFSTCFEQVSLQDSDGLEGCVAREIAGAIDASGEAERNCLKLDTIETQIDCAFIGTMVKQLRSRSNVAMTDSAWLDGEKALAQELTAVGLDQTFTCARDFDTKTPAFRTCMSSGIVAAMGGDPADAKACMGIADEEEFGQCVGEAGALKVLEEAAGRIGS